MYDLGPSCYIMRPLCWETNSYQISERDLRQVLTVLE